MTPDKLNEYRIFHLSASTFLPLVEKMHESAYDKLMADFREGEVELVAQVAKCESLHALKEEILTKANLYEKYSEKS
jgi:hypothetical protein